MDPMGMQIDLHVYIHGMVLPWIHRQFWSGDQWTASAYVDCKEGDDLWKKYCIFNVCSLYFQTVSQGFEPRF